VLRLPPFAYHRPATVDEAVALLGSLGEEAMPLAGGTDLLPNMKHGLFTPRHLVSLRGIEELRGIRVEGDDLVIGAGETLARVAAHPLVRQWTPVLSRAAGQVAGPQLRAMGTLGGNLALDTRCTYYNQTAFWRGALGFCLKKDGTVCHVTRVGKKCVAAHSADTPPALMVLGAALLLVGPGGRRQVPVSDFFVADGIRNTRREPGELIVGVRIPRPRPTFRAAYRKLRQRRSIDYPLLTVVVGGTTTGDGQVGSLAGVVTALGSRPRELNGWEELALGERMNDALLEHLAERAFAQCHPLDNITVDSEWRRAMVKVMVRRALEEFAASL
jgi:4-hydroxybenzoyl-CoA reductase subunit beta